MSKLQIAPKKLGNTYQPENHNDFKMILKFGESRVIDVYECQITYSEYGKCVQSYACISTPIAKSLLNAHNRGIKFEVILDKSHRTQKYSSATFLLNFGILTKTDSHHSIAHNKEMVIDGETVITGSFNVYPGKGRINGIL